MFFGHFLFALSIALLLAAVFGAEFRKHRWGADLLFFFILLFLLTWAGGIWITPFGPVVWGVPFFPFLSIGILFALLLAALIPSPETPERSVSREDIKAESRYAPGSTADHHATDGHPERRHRIHHHLIDSLFRRQ